MHAKPLSLLDLPWLPRLSPNFKHELGTLLETSDKERPVALRAVANQFLGLNQALSLSRTIRRMHEERPIESLSRFRLGLVSNATTDFLVPLLEATALRYGILLEVIAGAFDQVVQEALDPQSKINRAKPDAVLIAVDHRGLPFRSTGTAQWPIFGAEDAITQLDTVRAAFQANSGAACLVQTLPAPPELLFGSLDAGVGGTLRASIAQFNAMLAGSITDTGDVLIDIDWLAQSVGLHNWYNDRDWYLARMQFAQTALPLYAEFVVRVIAAIRGKARKCLILDLDNTLWGGVVGDDGLDGLALNPGDARGEAHRAVQALALDLRRRGIVLAVCSKNEDRIARQPFQSHPAMLLKETDFAVFAANWEDKASNIERIAQSLELGLDAMVFLDDNPVERAQVRQALPQVAVPELGDDPSTFARILACAGYFESVAFTNEDLARAQQYESNGARTELLASSRDMSEFLRSLQMEITFAPFNPTGRKRITQLINKTNQFNVTTRRYTEQEIAALERSPEHYTLQVSVRDRFGDNGMIGVVICRCVQEDWIIETWLMSCRVLNRKVEEAVCNRLVQDATVAGARTLRGSYVRTDRNDLVEDLFSRLGFTLASTSGNTSHWTLAMDEHTEFEVPFLEQV